MSSSSSGNGTHTGRAKGPRAIAILGPYGAGKTSLMESLLWVTGAIGRKSPPGEGSVGDGSAEARAHRMSVEANAATADYMGDAFTLIDCPGSVEFAGEMDGILPAVDGAIVVADPDPAKAALLQPVFRRLHELGLPHWVFVNKIDKAHARMRDLLAALQPVSPKPLVLRQIPIWQNGIVTGFIDLALERAFVYREHAPSELIDMPKALAEREKEARFQMLEKIADYDEHLMEELLSDIEPPRDEIFDDLSRELREGLIVPVLFGSAEKDNGVRRLLKALRHESPGADGAAKRLGRPGNGDTVVQTLKTYHGLQGGKVTLARVLSGSLKDGVVLHRADGSDVRVGGLFAMKGQELVKKAAAEPGEVVALGRLETVATGETLTTAKAGAKPLLALAPAPAVHHIAVRAADRKDDVKLTAAMAKLHEEDPSLSFAQHADTHEMVLSGQGEIHLRVAVERLKRKFGLALETHVPAVPYKETIRKPVSQRGRHKRQTGGHGQFGDVMLEIRPLPRGEGFAFEDRIVGGVVPKQWIPSVEKGVREALQKGPLGFPIVDIAVTLTDGSYHSVDSSDGAFQMAAKLAMSEGLPAASPVLLEPVMHVDIFVPSEATPRANAMISGRRGQILGFGAREGWPGWDVVAAHIPQAELQGLIVELRSATMGAGTYTARFDHLSELTGRLADQVIAHRKAA